MPAYDPNNIFAKILRGEMPCYKVYENDKVLAFLDIMPRAPGHTLVLPKAPARNILDIAPDDLAAVALGDAKDRQSGGAGIRRRRRDRSAIQRRRRRPGGLPPPPSRHPAQERRADEAAREREGKARRAVRPGTQAFGGA